MRRAWLLQANPKKWDIWSWWEDQREDLDSWTIAIHTDDVRPNDDFRTLGSAALRLVFTPSGNSQRLLRPFRVTGGNWITPSGRCIRGRHRGDPVLVRPPTPQARTGGDPDFSRSLVLRMPGTANPVPLEPREWRAIRRRVGGGRLRSKPSAGSPIVSARPLGKVPETSPSPPAAQDRKRTFREAALVKRYEAAVELQLLARSVRLPSGELLVCDAFDASNDILIEAKASSSRQDVRMAIGQLLDYRRHLGRRCALAVFVPEKPSDDLMDLLRSVKVSVIVEVRNGTFETVA